MTYFCGTHGLRTLGIADSEPRIVCDGCGLLLRIRPDRPPPAWFLNNKAPKGWVKGLKPNGTRLDKCPGCRAK